MKTSRGNAAAATWMFREDKSRQRRGCDVDIPWRRVAAAPPWRRVAATPPRRRGSSVETGARLRYGRWRILDAWRVPSRVWEALPDSGGKAAVEAALVRLNRVLLTGVSELNEDDKADFVAHCMEKSHWAKKIARKAPARDPFAGEPASGSAQNHHSREMDVSSA